ncbi:SDR family oxidoreductase [Acidisphaera sp. L21]|uniref:SDR family oxidoreductase n=1 Tax=Acidisphaera sp. L21 TaxID=1641851 RepID=UPI00157743A3|nr:SDR family oxidoreductase [Acidisphaera sp. L21]
MTEGATTPLPVRLDGLRVAITAGAGGIGRVIADSFAAAGARPYVSDIDEAALATCPYPCMIADAAKSGDLDRFMDAALAELGGLDVLVNNVGIAGPTKPVEQLDPAELDATLQICLASQFHCARRAVPALRAAGGGSIINLSSAAGKFGFALRSPYAAAKWGVVGFTRSLAIELGQDGIRVNALLPGLVEGPRIRSVIRNKALALGVGDNEQTERALLPVSLRCFVTQQDIANMALYLASPFGATISGQALSIDGGMESLS